MGRGSSNSGGGSGFYPRCPPLPRAPNPTGNERYAWYIESASNFSRPDKFKETFPSGVDDAAWDLGQEK